MAEKKIKILFLDHTPFIGGAQLSLIDHLLTINKERFEVVFGCSVNAQKLGLTDKLEKQGVKYKILDFIKLKSLNPIVLYKLFRDVFKVRSLIKEEKFDFVFANSVRTHILSCLAAVFLKTKVIWFMQDFTFPLLLFKILKYSADKIIYISKAAAIHYKEKVKVDNIVYIGSDFYKNQISDEQIKNKKLEWGIADNQTITIGYIGRLVKWKGADLLIKALPLLLNQKIDNFKCIIVGSGHNQKGNNEDYLKELVRKNNLENRVIFTGHRSDIQLCMSSMDIVCLTSLEPEPFGLVIVEGMMARSFIIATNYGGPVEILKDGQTGFLVEKNAESLAQALKIAIADPQLRKKIIGVAYEAAVNNFSVKKMTDDFEKIYYNLLN